MYHQTAMQIYTCDTPLPLEFHHAVLVIGNFDGMHQGHVALIEQAKDHAQKHGKPLGILTFEPHPRALFQPNESPFRITPPSVKRKRIAKTQIDFLVELDFTREIAQKSAADFVQDILIDTLVADHIFIGADFHFGQNRTGSADTIKAHGLDVTAIDIINDKNAQKFSSSQVRSCLRRGLIPDANDILGWNWYIEGPVIHGDKRGREMGFPTANVLLDDTIHPAFGVYATRVLIEGETKWRDAATNIGIRPMFETKRALVEAHIFDFDGEIYGKRLKISPVAKVRDEARYSSMDELITQIAKDCDDIRTILDLEKLG